MADHAIHQHPVGEEVRRVLLINPGHDGEHYQHRSHREVHRDPPPLGLLYVGTALSQMGYGVDILDTHVDADWQTTLDELLEEPYLWAGLSVIIGQRMANAAEITTILKERRPAMPVVWGGTMPTVMPEEMQEAYPDVDKMIVGEGEPDIGACEIPDWTLLGTDFNRDQVPYYHMLMTSRGCPMKCTFCYKHTATGGYRLTPYQAVIEQMEQMNRQVGTTVFTIGDDNFLGHEERARKILRYMRVKGWYFEEVIGHIGQLTTDLIDAMAGVVQTFIFSVETVAPELQELLKKGIALDSVYDKLVKLYRHGIVCNCSFIFGLPTETEENRRANWAYMEKLRRANPWCRGVSYVYFPLPGTPLLEWTERKLKVNLHFAVDEYEHANFWPAADDPWGARFRPWMSEAEYQAVVADALAFRERWRLPEGYRPYVLDRVLRKETINLRGDLPRV